MIHPHGPHKCYCPSCGYEMMAETSQQCNQLSCPECGGRMRAVDTGEYRLGNPIAENGLSTVFKSILVGVGIAIGFLMVNKAAEKIKK